MMITDKSYAPMYHPEPVLKITFFLLMCIWHHRPRGAQL